MRPSGCYLCNHRYAGSEQRFSTVGFGSVSNQRSSSERKRRDCIAREGPPCLCQINKFESQSVELKLVHLVVHGALLLGPTVALAGLNCVLSVEDKSLTSCASVRAH